MRRLGFQAQAAVAQMVEHVIRNDGVGGSSPFSGTSSSEKFRRHKAQGRDLRLDRSAK